MKFYVFFEGSNLCSSCFDDLIYLMVFLYECEIERLQVVILFDNNVYRYYFNLDESLRNTSIYDFLQFIRNLKEGLL